MTTNKCARYLVAEEDGRVIAYAGAWLIFEEGHITNIAVDEPYRGRGVGTEVTRALMQYAANLGVAVPHAGGAKEQPGGAEDVPVAGVSQAGPAQALL